MQSFMTFFLSRKKQNLDNFQRKKEYYVFVFEALSVLLSSFVVEVDLNLENRSRPLCLWYRTCNHKTQFKSTSIANLCQLKMSVLLKKTCFSINLYIHTVLGGVFQLKHSAETCSF